MWDKRFFSWAIPTRWLPVRAIICVMMFTACWTSYMCRLQMPILAVPMIAAEVNNSSVSGACVQEHSADVVTPKLAALWRNPDDVLHDIVAGEISRSKRQADDKLNPGQREIGDLMSGRPFDWSPQVRGQLLAAYAYGNVPGNLLGGIMSMRFGPRQTILWTSLVAAIASLLSPILANIHWGALLGTRVLVGLTGGVIFPACHTMVAKWSPPDEKARFVWSLLGGTFGTILTYPMIAGIADHVNWECGWYIPSALMLVWVFFWYLLAYDSPLEHPAITEEEKNFIITSQAGTVRSEKPSLKETPLGQIFSSVPFLSLVVCHFGNLFLLFFYQNSMMLYLTKALGFQLTKGGFLASLPWLGRMVFGFFFSWAGDTVKKRQIISLTAFRKCATIFSHFLPGICLIVVGYVGCSFTLANVFLFLALGFNGAASIANLSNNQDLSPNYAGFLYGIMNTIGTTTGMIIPPMVEAIAGKYGNPIDKWQIVFWIGAAVCIFCMIVFIIGGSAKIQSWNEPRQRDAKNATSANA
ncbi:sialin isoform X2 [Nasonia vitripennis]|uniref:Major facilitator superfamily (MFS) profile domain-containing protein n=1 Tax=Nasonia vitripennis TaxID=7425 RepID=A0A7M7G8A1_NASVI|nr:sialin isoform X2 [Nasonia vitripennis]